VATPLLGAQMQGFGLCGMVGVPVLQRRLGCRGETVVGRAAPIRCLCVGAGPSLANHPSSAAWRLAKRPPQTPPPLPHTPIHQSHSMYTPARRLYVIT
jgi:hypothetical protein